MAARRTATAPPPAASPTSAASAGDVWALAEVVTRMRRVLRASIRSDYPWERLPMAQVEILQRLADEPGLRVTELAARHKLAVNTVSNVIQQMVVAGLVDRQVDARDRRAVTLQLTEPGREQLTGWLSANARRLDAAFQQLSAADRTSILHSLPSLTRLVETMEAVETTAIEVVATARG